MDKETKITIESYNKTAESFIKRTDSLHPKEISDRFLKLIKGKGLILDIGCGQGRDVEYFVNKGYDVIGIDLSEKLIEYAKNNIKNAKFELMDSRNLTFPNNKFDAIWANAILVHIPKKEAIETLKGIKRIMKDDGIMMISIKTRKYDKNEEIIEKDKRHENVEKFWVYYDKEEFTEYLNKAGFKIIEVIEKYNKDKHPEYSWIYFFCKNQK